MSIQGETTHDGGVPIQQLGRSTRKWGYWMGSYEYHEMLQGVREDLVRAGLVSRGPASEGGAHDLYDDEMNCDQAPAGPPDLPVFDQGRGYPGAYLDPVYKEIDNEADDE